MTWVPIGAEVRCPQPVDGGVGHPHAAVAGGIGDDRRPAVHGDAAVEVLGAVERAVGAGVPGVTWRKIENDPGGVGRDGGPGGGVHGHRAAGAVDHDEDLVGQADLEVGVGALGGAGPWWRWPGRPRWPGPATPSRARPCCFWNAITAWPVEVS